MKGQYLFFKIISQKLLILHQCNSVVEILHHNLNVWLLSRKEKEGMG